MTTNPEHKPAPVQDRLDEWTQVSDKTIVAHHQLVQLTARREILIFKTVRFARFDWPERAAHDLFVDGGEFITRPGKEASDHRKAVPDRLRTRWSQRQR